MLPSTLELLVSELGQSASNTHLYLYSHHSHQLPEETEKGFLKLWDMYQPNWQFRSFATNLPGIHFLCPLFSFGGSSSPCRNYTSSTTHLSSSWKRVWEKSVLKQSEFKSFDNLYAMKWKVISPFKKGIWEAIRKEEILQTFSVTPISSLLLSLHITSPRYYYHYTCERFYYYREKTHYTCYKPKIFSHSSEI